jgi:hypothetical protein
LKYQQQGGSSCNFQGRREKMKGKKFIGNKLNHQHWYKSLHMEEDHWRFQQHGWRAFLNAERRRTRCLKCSSVSRYYTHICLFIYIYSNSKLFISWHSNNEKIIVKKQKSPLTLVFKILLLRAFWSFSLCFIIIFYFIIFNQISNFFSLLIL